MTSSQMVCHLIDQLRIALGELPTQPVSGVFRYPPFKQVVINVLPWPKGRIQGPPEAFTTVSTEWEKDVTRLQQLLEEPRSAGGADRMGAASDVRPDERPSVEPADVPAFRSSPYAVRRVNERGVRGPSVSYR